MLLLRVVPNTRWLFLALTACCRVVRVGDKRWRRCVHRFLGFFFILCVRGAALRAMRVRGRPFFLVRLGTAFS